MAKIEVTVTEELTGSRLDKAIVTLVEGASRARVKRTIDEGEVRLNGRRAPKGAVVTAGDVIVLEDTVGRSADEACIPEPDAKLDVRFETSAVLIVEKPAGQPTTPLRADEKGTLAGALLGKYPELAGVGYSALEPGVVHRLDTDTSGLVVVARTKAAFETLRDALQSEQLQKEYLLICQSDGLPDDGVIEHPIANHPKDQKRVYPCVHPRDVMRYAPRPALTKFSVVKRVSSESGSWALVRATAPRAVRHQLRAHFAAIEHALAGDKLYGVDGSLGRHALHASRVAFEGAGQPELRFDVTSDLPADMQALITPGT